MKKFLAILFILPVLALGFESFTPLTQPAEAARLGGGRSFGSRPNFSRPAPQRNVQQPAQQPRTGTAGAAAAPRPGLGGFLGPLLAGSMLGALFFGGAFSGIGMVDILIIGLAVYMLTRMLRRFGSAAAGQARSGSAASAGTYGNAQQYNKTATGGDMWGSLRSAPDTSGVSSAAFGVELPKGFDLPKFMEGAKIMYARMQGSWDKRDLEDISQFTTPGMYREIKEQAANDPTPSRTDILTLNAQIYGFEANGTDESIAVYFDALVREEAGKPADNAREVWTFTRTKGGTWKLDGIQQVEA
ncbi:39S ribosomal protein L45 [Desulfovibrio sp. OttesenSCG-928-F07]|nr:39S ribosomal protein L45 [Desulfovibrio sp. OttesenSCG-928-F07]